MNRIKIALAAVVVLFLGALTVSAAAQLNLLQPRQTTAKADPRCVANVKVEPGAASGYASSVTVSDLPAACSGANVSLTLARQDGTPVTSVAGASFGAVTGGRGTLTVPAFLVTEVASASITLATWGVPATWVAPPPPLLSCVVPGRPDVACTVKRSDFDAWAGGFSMSVSVTTKPALPSARWQITVNLADTALPQRIRSVRSDLPLAAGMNCASLPILKLNRPLWDVGNTGDPVLFYVGGHTTPTDDAILNCP